MIGYLATVNTSGYSPMDDDPPVFDNPRDAWAYLLHDREVSEEFDETPEYSETHEKLRKIASNPLNTLHTDSTGCGLVHGPTPGYTGNHDLGQNYAVTLVIENPSAADVWPHVKPRLVMLGKGLKGHGTVGVTTGCGKVWSGPTTAATDYDADAIDCQRCVTAIDKQNAWNRKIGYGASASFEQDSFAAGAGTEATEWRGDYYSRETVSAEARKLLKIIPTRPARGANR